MDEEKWKEGAIRSREEKKKKKQKPKTPKPRTKCTKPAQNSQDR
jgi:hypothetical protein